MKRAGVIDADRALGMTETDWSSLNQDLLHLSREGYRRLTAAVPQVVGPQSHRAARAVKR